MAMWDPFEELERMHEVMDGLFGSAFRSTRLLPGQGALAKNAEGFRWPVSDVHETANSIVATVELPGASKDDVSLNVTDDSIEVKAERKVSKEDKNEGSYRYEVRSSQFYRRLPLPASIDAENAKASLKDGVLRIEAPKKHVGGRQHTVAIE